MAEIARVYASRDSAQTAVSSLLRAGFSEDSIVVTQYPAQHGHWSVSVHARFGSGQAATDVLEANHPSRAMEVRNPSPELEQISRLSAWKSPRAISTLSGPKSPASISRLSGWKSPGAISRLSGHKSPGAIS